MAFVRSGPAQVEIDGAVSFAVRKLGYIRPDAAGELAELIASDWEGFCSGARFLRTRPDLFTDKGLAKLGHAITALRCQITFDVRTTVFNGTEHLWSKHCANVRLRASVKACCAASLAIDGLLLPRQQRFELPLLECDAEWCSCAWMQEVALP